MIESNALHPSYKSSVLKRVQLVLAVSRLEAWQRVFSGYFFLKRYAFAAPRGDDYVFSKHATVEYPADTRLISYEYYLDVRSLSEPEGYFSFPRIVDSKRNNHYRVSLTNLEQFKKEARMN